MNIPTFSIVVPVYKVEKYLPECVDCILAQTYKNYEVILVDDGSPDNCPSLCDEYMKKDKRIRVIHKLNGGLSSARNAGTDVAIGEYIVYIDSDDYWKSKDYLLTLASKANGSIDILFWGCTDYSSLSCKSIEQHPNITQEKIDSIQCRDEVLCTIFDEGAFPGAAWIVAVRRNLLLHNQIKFVEGIKAEDIDWLLNVFTTAKSYAVIDNCDYIYRKYREGSITSTADMKSFKDIMYTVKKWSRQETSNKLDSCINGLLSKHYLCALLILGKLSAGEEKKCLQEAKQYKYLLKYNSSWIIRMAGKLPLNLLTTVLMQYHKRRRF